MSQTLEDRIAALEDMVEQLKPGWRSPPEPPPGSLIKGTSVVSPGLIRHFIAYRNTNTWSIFFHVNSFSPIHDLTWKQVLDVAGRTDWHLIRTATKWEPLA